MLEVAIEHRLIAIEHRLMHAETLAYMLHQLPVDRKIAPSDALSQRESSINLKHETVQVPAGEVTLGLTRESGLFGWDNEFGEVREQVPAFEIDRYMVTNGDWLNFMEAGGYDNRAFWTGEDWAWKEQSGVEHPAFWVPRSQATDSGSSRCSKRSFCRWTGRSM